MNVLQRSMFANGGAAISLSPELIDYAESLDIDPIGKTSEQLKNEINSVLEQQTQEEGPGFFRSTIFDYKDPLDYLSTGLLFTGIGAGLGGSLKLANLARKAEKAKDAAARAKKTTGQLIKENPLKTGIGGAAAVGTADLFIDSDLQDTIEAPDFITAELSKLSEEERKQTETQNKKKREEAAAKAAKDEKDKINETLRILQTRAGEFDEAEKERISQERRDNAFTLMQEIGSAMVETGQIDRGLALGATRASERISAEKLAEKLAQKEAKEKLAEEQKISDKTFSEVTERYKEAARSLSKQKNLERIVSEMEQSVSTGDVTGARGAIARLFDDIAGFTGFGDEFISKATEAAEQEKYVEAQVIQDILQESGRTISDRDRELIKQLIANLEDVFTGSAKALKSLARVRLNIRDSMESSKAEIDTLNTKYRDRIPELSNYDRIYSISTDESQGFVDEDDAVLQADEIDV
mgnify:FL=1